MDYSVIAAPLIGSAIGYATNYIAVKMMFRPLKPIKLGKYTLPFTPGIIPKGKPRIAKAIANVISSSLLSKEIIQETLLSEEQKEKVAQAVHASFTSLASDERSIEDMITTYVDHDHLETYKISVVDYLTNRVDQQLQSKPVGEFIAHEVIRTVKENLKGGLLGLFANDNLMNAMSVKIQTGIDEYLAKNSCSLILPVITEECDKLLSTRLDSISEKLNTKEEEITSVILKIYERIITDQLDAILNSIDIASIVENRINAMDMLELEALILSVMKKELNAIVNLGALIGFILGLLNLLF